MKTGISTACLYPLETEKSLGILLEAGYRTFELFFNSPSELEEEYLDRLCGRLSAAGGEIYSYHLFLSGFEPVMFFSDYPRRFEDSLELYRRWAVALARRGARVAVLHGARRDTQMTAEEYCERFLSLSGALAAEGVTLAQENVCRCASALCANIRRMRECAGRGGMKFILDVKQALRAGEDPFAMLEAMGEDIAGVHVSDNAPGRDCLLPGEGNMEFARLADALCRYGYDGPLLVEVYRQNVEDPGQLVRSRHYLEGVLRKFLGGTSDFRL